MGRIVVIEPVTAKLCVPGPFWNRGDEKNWSVHSSDFPGKRNLDGSKCFPVVSWTGTLSISTRNFTLIPNLQWYQKSGGSFLRYRGKKVRVQSFRDKKRDFRPFLGTKQARLEKVSRLGRIGWHHVKERVKTRLGVPDPRWTMRGVMDLQGQKQAKTTFCVDFGRFRPFLATRTLRLLGNHWADRAQISWALVWTYATSYPAPSARQMFLAAWESPFLRRKKTCFHTFVNNFTTTKDTDNRTSDMDSSRDLQSSMTSLHPWKRKDNPNLDLQKKYSSHIEADFTIGKSGKFYVYSIRSGQKIWPYHRFTVHKQSETPLFHLFCIKGRQHPDFPGGHPPEYYPSLRLLNFAERTGYGFFSLIWPSTSDTI